MALEGTCKSYNPVKGFGFISYNDQDVFLHVRDIQGGSPQAGDVLNFDAEDSNKNPGQLKALNVTGGTGPEDGGKGAGKGNNANLGVLGNGAYQAVVKSFSGADGWGFIDYEGQDIFLHIRDCALSKPRKGDTVAFDMEKGTKEGSMKAVNVTGGTAPFDDKGKGKGADGGFGMMSGFGGKGKDAYSPYGGGGKGYDAWGGKAPAWGGMDPWGGKGGGKDMWGGKDPWGGKGCGKDMWGGKDPWGGKGGGKDMWGGKDPWGGKGGGKDMWGGKDPFGGKGFGKDAWGGKGMGW